MSAIQRYNWDGDRDNHGDLVLYDDHIAAMRERDARIEALERALREIVDYEPVFENQDPVEWGQEPCPGCERVREDKWPPSGLCEKHYAMVSRLTATNERHRNYQYINMRAIARAALAPSFSQENEGSLPAATLPAQTPEPWATMDRAQDEQEAAYQAQIDEDRQAFRYARDDEPAPAPCPECGGTGIARRPEPDGGMWHVPCPRGCKTGGA